MIDKDKLMEYLIVTDQVDEFLGLKQEKEEHKTKTLEFEYNKEKDESE